MQNDAASILRGHWTSLALLDGDIEIVKLVESDTRLDVSLNGDRFTLSATLYGTDSEVTLPQTVDGARLYNGTNMLKEEAVETFDIRETTDDMTIDFTVVISNAN